MMTADAPAACAFFAFVAKVTSPRRMGAMWPFAAAGKSAAVLPRPQLTKVSVVVPSGEPPSGTEFTLPELVVTYEIAPVPVGTVERTSTPGESTAATATTPGYAAG